MSSVTYEGKTVLMGQTIGKLGNSGNASNLRGSEVHVHFGIKSGGIKKGEGMFVDPVGFSQ
jgi:murein DD-endopeptidase MepM/ murein hydrolase activator NlpD